jgi:hypothetical protein
LRFARRFSRFQNNLLAWDYRWQNEPVELSQANEGWTVSRQMNSAKILSFELSAGL